jgi:hypothetical protein
MQSDKKKWLLTLPGNDGATFVRKSSRNLLIGANDVVQKLIL